MMKRFANSDDISVDLLLGDDIMSEILNRLPAMKSLVCCKSVCKRWRSLINERRLIDLHLARLKARTSLVIRVAKESHHVIELYKVDDLFQSGAAIHWLTVPRCGIFFPYSVNGLLCAVGSSNEGEGEGDVRHVRIFNTNTRELTPPIEQNFKMEIVKEEHGVEVVRLPNLGFGCDSYANVTKVICVWEMDRSTAEHVQIGVDRVCEVMTVGDNIWRRIDAVPPYNIRGWPANVNGSIFWMNAGPNNWEAPDCNALVVFDVASEKFSLIKIPNHVLSESKPIPCPHLLEVDGRIAMIYTRKSDCRVTLWIIDRVEVVVNDTDAATSTATWNGTVYTSNWIEETISMPFDDWDGTQDLEFQPIVGTDMIMMKSYEKSRRRPRDYANLYCYDRKTKTSKMIEITGIDSLKAYPYRYSMYTIIESLYPVQILEKQHQQLQQEEEKHTQPPPCKKLKQ